MSAWLVLASNRSSLAFSSLCSTSRFCGEEEIQVVREYKEGSEGGRGGTGREGHWGWGGRDWGEGRD